MNSAVVTEWHALCRAPAPTLLMQLLPRLSFRYHRFVGCAAR